MGNPTADLWMLLSWPGSKPAPHQPSVGSGLLRKGDREKLEVYREGTGKIWLGPMLQPFSH